MRVQHTVLYTVNGKYEIIVIQFRELCFCHYADDLMMMLEVCDEYEFFVISFSRLQFVYILSFCQQSIP